MAVEGDALGSEPAWLARVNLIEYDLSEAVQHLRRLRFAEYFLICFGFYLTTDFAGILVVSVRLGMLGDPIVLMIVLVDVVLLAAAIVAYLGCGNLRPDIWRIYVFIFPVAALAAFWTGVNRALSLLFVPMEFFTWFFSILWISACITAVIVALLGMRAVRRLRWVKLSTTSRRVLELIELSRSVRSKAALGRGRGRLVNWPLGIFFLCLGLIFVLLAGLFAWLLGFFFIFKARQYLQVSAYSLLATDRRQPILFLRSFADDAAIGFAITPAEMVTKALDWSVETRLANYFMGFGPFIAIGRPGEKVPAPGAARVQLSDDQWQQWVINQMNSSSIILMYAGVSHWVVWELSRVLEAHLTEKLILLFKGSDFKEDMNDRLARAKLLFAGERWRAPMENVYHPETLVAARFDGAGGVTVFRSKRRNNDAFQIAVEIAHLASLGWLSAELTA
jgi:hypothetical protein